MKEELLRIFCKKITQELQLYKCRKLQESPVDVFDSAFEIDSMISIYEALVEASDRFDCCQLQNLIAMPDVISSMYGAWLKYEDSSWRDYMSCITSVVSKLNSTRHMKREVKQHEKISIHAKYFETGVA